MLVECPVCGGKGLMEGDGSGWDGTSYHTPGCETCGGTGVVPESVAQLLAKFDDGEIALSDTGILGETVKILGRGYFYGKTGKIISIHKTRKEPSFRVEVLRGEMYETVSLKRNEFKICKPWQITKEDQ